MAPTITNRFALFAERSPTPDSPHRSPIANQLTDQLADADVNNPWQEIKRGGQLIKMKTLVIRDTYKPPPFARHHPKQMRDASGSTQDSDKSDRRDDPYEHWCGVCQIKLPSKNALLAHIKQAPRPHENYCNLCKRVFKDRNGLKNHVDNSLGHETFCNLCLSAFKDAWGLKNHFENNYSVGHEFVCLTCLLGFRTKHELDRHLYTGEKHVWCDTCHRKFRNQVERDEHWIKTMRHKHCLQPGCDFDAVTANALEKHLWQDHFQCEGCKRVFPSQSKLNLHHETCLFEHMTKHTAADIPCWRCDLPMRKCSSLINHLESGNCPNLPDTTLLMRCLGKFWHSTLYMDIDMHVQIRTDRVDLDETASWVKDGLLHPFLCRAPRCGKVFGHFSSLVLHVESQACGWDVETLRFDLLKEEFGRVCARRDSKTTLMT
ncbi:hypothetical protein N0V90_003776 [Kalmusia sp. IMI 367209]|nr:hypothetical protein N0V90_003776 [Kalmusia sp. IMI 367209]